MAEFPKTLFVHGRPAPHPAHAYYAKLIHAEFQVEDPVLRWHDKTRGSKVIRYLSWITNAVRFSRMTKYTVFLAECARIPLAVMNKLNLISKEQKIIALLDDEQLYFIKNNYYSTSAAAVSKFFINNCHGFIVVGKMQENILSSLMKNGTLNINPYYVRTFNGISQDRFDQLKNIEPDLQSKNIIYIANGPGQFRIHYKGLDLLIQSFVKAQGKIPELSLQIIGEWTKEAQSEVLFCVPSSVAAKISFEGKVSTLSHYLKNTSLYLHPARGEAWGIAINEAMTAGIPCLVSEWTGAQEMVEQVDPRLIFSLEPGQIADKICWYFSLNSEEKKYFSEQSKRVASQYTEKAAGEQFVKMYQKLLHDLQKT